VSDHDRRRLSIVVAPLALALALACGPSSEEPPAPEKTTPPAAAAPAAGASQASASASATEIFATRCATCHGVNGAGNGPASEGLTPPPRNFGDPGWQSSVTDAHIEQIIQYGGAAVGKSPAMPANPDLMSKPEVVAALRAYIRGLAAR
jgi:mono/diheme cytochrome c family protein